MRGPEPLSRRALAGASLVLTVASTVGAQGWSLQPDGHWGYTADYRAAGFFSCAPAVEFVAGSCLASGNQLVLGSRTGTATLTLTYNGVVGSLTASRPPAIIPLGTLTQSLVGTGFLFPETRTPTSGSDLLTPSWALGIGIWTSAPVASSGGWGYGHRIENDPGRIWATGCCRTPNYAILATSPPPAGVVPGPLIVTIQNAALMVDPLDPTPIEFTAAIAFAPEPSAIALTAGGLLALAVAGARRGARRRAGRARRGAA